MEADGFRDRNQRYGFLIARENARRILADPAPLEAGRRHLERFPAGDPRRRDGYALWSALLDEGAGEVAARLTERGAQGDDTRGTAPSLRGLPGPVRARLLREARSPLNLTMMFGAVERRGRAAISERADIAHLVWAAAGVTSRDTFVIVGTGAVIAQRKTVPLDLMEAREIDIYVPDDLNGDGLSDLINGSIGDGSPFGEAFGSYAHGVGPLTACLPDDWSTKAIRYELPNLPGVVCLCPEVNDIALSKLSARRDKDRAWIAAGLGAGVLRLDAMLARGGSISNPNAPDGEEIARRLTTVGQMSPGKS